MAFYYSSLSQDKALSPNSVTLGVRVSTYESWENTIQSITVPDTEYILIHKTQRSLSSRSP